MPDELRITATEDTPEVVFNNKSGSFLISGRSLPEDAFLFYNNIIEWLVEYSKTPNSTTNFQFNLEYFNTASAKQIFKIASLLCELSKKSEVNVKWHYDEGDKDMQASGSRFSKLCGINFDLVKN
ncbi:MAG: DUF1987 domain-containing protein [Bacteroidia bacterium]|nr:DUF1987 domain-containing protein [Bacteroidia bacterium]